MLETLEEYKIIRDEFNTGPFPLVALKRLCETFDSLRAVARAAKATRPLAAQKAWAREEVQSVHELDEALDALPLWVLEANDG